MSIEIVRPWARIQTAQSRQAGGFMTLTNKGTAPDRLIGASSPAADSIAIHAIKVVGSDLRMRPLDKGLGLPAGTAIELKPRGYHLFIEGLKAPLVRGEKLPVTLTFETAGQRQVELVVEAEGLIGKDTLGSFEPEKAG